MQCLGRVMGQAIQPCEMFHWVPRILVRSPLDYSSGKDTHHLYFPWMLGTLTSNVHDIQFSCGTSPGNSELLFRSPLPLGAHLAGGSVNYSWTFISLSSSSGDRVPGNRAGVLCLCIPGSGRGLGPVTRSV